MTTTLVLGTASSGSTAHAQSLLRHHERVTCLTTAQRPSTTVTTEARARLGRSAAARPAGWTTVPTTSLSMALLAARHAVLVASVRDWVWSVVEAEQAWADPRRAADVLAAALDEASVALRALPQDVVLVSEEPPCHLPGAAEDPLLAELLAVANQRLAAACAHVHVVLAGRVLDLSSAPIVTTR